MLRKNTTRKKIRKLPQSDSCPTELSVAQDGGKPISIARMNNFTHSFYFQLFIALQPDGNVCFHHKRSITPHVNSARKSINIERRDDFWFGMLSGCQAFSDSQTSGSSVHCDEPWYAKKTVENLRLRKSWKKKRSIISAETYYISRGKSAQAELMSGSYRIIHCRLH